MKKKRRLLIVDDEKDVVSVLKDLFVSKGYDVYSAFTGREAIRYLQGERPEVILLDIRIPDINGVDILKQAKKRYPKIKVVVLTGFLEEYRAEIEKIGCNALLHKPFSIKTLIGVLESTLSERKEDKEDFSRLVEMPGVLARARLLFIEPNEIMFSSKLVYFRDVRRCKGKYELASAFTEKEVLNKLNAFRPDIVLSNISMFRLYKLAERFRDSSNPPKDVILYGISGSEDFDKDKDSAFIGGFFDPVTAAVSPKEMNKLGEIVRATAIAHRLFVERKEIDKRQKIKRRIAADRALYFGWIFNISFFAFAVGIFYIQERVIQVFGLPRAVRLFSILLIVLSAMPLERMLVKWTDRFLFQKRYPHQAILVQASRGMVLITDVYKLLNLIVHVVKRYMRVKNVSIFQYDEQEGAFVLRCSRGGDRRAVGRSIRDKSPLILRLKENKGALLYKDAKIGPALKAILEDLDCEVCVPSFWKGELLGFLILGAKLSGYAYTKEETGMLSTLANEVAIAIENAKNFNALEKVREQERQSYFQTVLALAKTVDEKDTYTRGHLDEVARYGMEVASELSHLVELKINMDELKTTLLLHDIGKIGVPDALLHKDGRLTREEWSIMKQHPDIGARIIEPIDKLRRVGRIIRHHQEKYDGTGYPDGLKGEDIPLESRIIAVVDAYHAMISDRPYRKALSEKRALSELRKNTGRQFDPAVVKAFVKAWEDGKIKKL